MRPKSFAMVTEGQEPTASGREKSEGSAPAAIASEVVVTGNLMRDGEGRGGEGRGGGGGV